MSIAKNERKVLNVNKIGQVYQKSPEYPELLKQIYKPPKSLFFRGDLSGLLARFPLAIVGSRKVSDYGRESISEIISGMPNNTAIISGLALGADGHAHECALRNDLYTLAVLGSGIADNDIYPRSNFNLAKRILESGGCLLSEYPPGTNPLPQNFPSRNRIISGLARAVIVAEAAAASGSLITAEFALEEGRDLWAIPGPISSALSVGTNHLIYKGAMPAISTRVIIEEYSELSNFEPAKKCLENGLSKKILDFLRGKKICSTEDLFCFVSASTDDINHALTDLEIEGKIIFESGFCRIAI